MFYSKDVLCIWIYIATTIFKTSFALPFTSNDLDITENIKPFQGCTIHVIESQLFPPILPTSFLEDILGIKEKEPQPLHHHTIKPIHFPVVRSNIKYSQKHDSKKDAILCDNTPFAIHYSQKGNHKVYHSDFKFTATPQYRLLCHLSVYISPWKYCKSWKIREREGHPTNFDKLLYPPSFQDIIIKNLKTKQDKANGLFPQILRGNIFLAYLLTKVSAEQPFKTNIMYGADVQGDKRMSERVFGACQPIKLVFIVQPETNTAFQHQYFAETEDTWNLLNQAVKKCTLNTAEGADATLEASLCVRKLVRQNGKYLFRKYTVSESISEFVQLPWFTGEERAAKFTQRYIWNLHCSACNIKSTNVKNLAEGKQESKYHNFLKNTKHMSVESLFLLLLFPNSTLVYEEPRFVYGDNGFALPHFFVEEDTREHQYILRETKGHYFLICSDIVDSGGLSLFSLVKAYDLATWIATAATTLTFAVVLAKLQKSEKGITLHGIWISLCCLFEQSVELANRKDLRVLMWSWVLMSLIITNGYRGDNIKEVTAPLEQKRLETFDQLIQHNFTFYSAIDWQMSYEALYFLTLVAGANSFRGYLSERLFMQEAFDDFTSFSKVYNKSVTSANRSLLQQIRRRMWIPDSYSTIKDIQGNSSFFAKKILECDDNAFVHNHDNILPLYLKLKSINETTMRQVTMSKESLAPTTKTWIFNMVPVETYDLIRKTHSVVESGVVELWDRWHLWLLSLNDTKAVAQKQDNGVRRLAMKDNILVVFILLVGLVSIASLSFLAEVCSKFAKFAKIEINKIFAGTKVLIQAFTALKGKYGRRLVSYCFKGIDLIKAYYAFSKSTVISKMK